MRGESFGQPLMIQRKDIDFVTGSPQPKAKRVIVQDEGSSRWSNQAGSLSVRRLPDGLGLRRNFDSQKSQLMHKMIKILPSRESKR